jgi:hypothetical protein
VKKIPLWPLFLLTLAAVVAWVGEPKPVALVVAGLGALTAAYDLFRELDR